MDQLALFNPIDGQPTVEAIPTPAIAVPEPPPPRRVMTSWQVPGRVLRERGYLSLVELNYPTSPNRWFCTERLTDYDPGD